MLTFSLTRQPRTFAQTANAIAEFRPIATHAASHLFRRYARSYENVTALADSINRIARSEFGYHLQLPPPPMGGAEVAAGLHGRPADFLEERLASYVDQLDGAARACPYFGTVEYLDRRSVRFTYCESTKQTGLFDRTYTVTRKVHDLVDAKECKLTDPDALIPKRQQRLVALLPAAVLPHVRVIRGMLVQVEQHQAGVEVREHALGRGLREAGRIAQTHGPTAAKSALGTAAAVGAVAALYALGTVAIAALAAPAAAVVGTAAVVAIADPAIVIGDLVISGWLEGAR